MTCDESDGAVLEGPLQSLVVVTSTSLGGELGSPPGQEPIGCDVLVGLPQ